MSKRNRRYTEVFKQKAVELSHTNKTVKQVCEDLDVPISVLTRWRQEFRAYGKNSFPGKGKPKLTDDQRKIAELQKKLRESELENQILKKAVSIFSKSDKRNIDL
jgi:transposase